MVEIEVAATSPDGLLLGEPQLANVMVDSGAEFTILDDRLAPLLGLDLQQLPPAPMIGIGTQEVPGRAYHNTMIGLCGIWVVATVVFQERPSPSLLGRQAIFERLGFGFFQGQSRLLAAA